jgi:hypothetical protein
MYGITSWLDHAVSPPNLVKLTDNHDGTYTMLPAGTVVQQGTNMSAAHFNNMESGILAGYTAAIEFANFLRMVLKESGDSKTQLGELISELDNDKFPEIDRQIHLVEVLGLEAITAAKKAIDGAEAQKLVVLTTTCTNSQKYPFNNSTKTIALSGANLRYTKDYTVTAEIVSYTGGCVGDIVISDKLLNGFKIGYTGSATSVELKIYVQGGT